MNHKILVLVGFMTRPSNWPIKIPLDWGSIPPVKITPTREIRFLAHEERQSFHGQRELWPVQSRNKQSLFIDVLHLGTTNTYSHSWIVYLIVATSCCWNLFRSSCKVSSVRSSRCFNCKVSKQPGMKQISEVSTTFIPNAVWFSLVGGFRQLGSFPLEFIYFFVICWEHSLRKNTDKTDLLPSLLEMEHLHTYTSKLPCLS